MDAVLWIGIFAFAAVNILLPLSNIQPSFQGACWGWVIWSIFAYLFIWFSGKVEAKKTISVCLAGGLAFIIYFVLTPQYKRELAKNEPPKTEIPKVEPEKPKSPKFDLKKLQIFIEKVKIEENKKVSVSNGKLDVYAVNSTGRDLNGGKAVIEIDRVNVTPWDSSYLYFQYMMQSNLQERLGNILIENCTTGLHRATVTVTVVEHGEYQMPFIAECHQ